MPRADAPLIETKLRPPRAAGVRLARPRLSTRFRDLLARPLTIVSAPAGFGKTTLLVEWHEALLDGAGTAWLSLDAGDNDPDRFARYLAEAVDRATRRLLPQGEDDGRGVARWPEGLTLEAVVEVLLGRLYELGEPVVLFLDDYHFIGASRVHAGLGQLVEHLPEHLHLVIGSRRDPPLPLARLRARQQLAEVRADELRFTAPETAGFFEQAAGLALSEAELQTLASRTEGWIAALQLAAHSVQRRRESGDFVESFSGSHRFVFDYLAEEVFAALDEATQSFLLQTSPLSRLSGPICDAVTGGTDGALRLEDLHRSNLFTIALDEERHWYRYHHLFGDFLRRLLQERMAGMIPDLHRRAAAWFEDEGLIDEALQHAVASGDAQTAFRVIDRVLPAAVLRGEYGAAARWLGDLPRRDVESRPRLAIPLAVTQLMEGRVQLPRRIAKQVEDVLDGRLPLPHPMSESERANHRGALALIRAYIARYEGRSLHDTLAITDQALAELPDSDLRARAWLHFLRAVILFEHWQPDAEAQISAGVERCFSAGHLSGAVGLLTLTVHRLMLRGQLREAEQHVGRALEQGYERHALPALGLLHAVAGDLYYERGRLDLAEREIRRDIELGAPGAAPGLFVPSEATLVRILMARGERDAAREMLLGWSERAHSVETRQGGRFFPALEADLRLRLEGLDSFALDWSERPEDPDIPVLASEYPRLVRARIWRTAGRHRDALATALAVLESAQAHGRGGRALEARVQAALALDALRRTDDAMQVLRPALILAQREGYLRTFVDEGDAIVGLLQRAVRDNEHSGYASRLLGMIPLAGQSAAVGSQDGAALDALSDRELEVLKLLAQGLANREMADALVVSLDTVKTHLRHIYEKLDVHSRTQAVSRAREIGVV